MGDPILDELEVEVDEPAPEPEIEVVDAGKKPETDKADELAALKAQIAKSAAEVAERDRQIAELAARNQRAEHERNQAIQQRFGAQDAAVANALASASNEAKQYKAEYTRLLEEGKFAEAADVNDKLVDARFREKQAQQQAQWLTQKKAEFNHQLQADTEQRERMEEQAAQPKTSDRAQQWIAQHPRFNTDAAYRYKALAAHEEALASGIQPDSDEYFDHINAAVEEGGAVQQQTPQRQAPKPSKASMGAGPSRSGGAGAGNGAARRTVTLTPEQREWADISMPNLEPAERYKRYARNLEAVARKDREALAAT